MRALRQVSHAPKHRLSGDEKQGNALATAPVVNGIVLRTGPWRPSSVAFTATHISGTPSLIAPVVDGLRCAQTRDMIARRHQTQFALLLLLAVSL